MISANDHSTETSIFVFENHLESREKINEGIFCDGRYHQERKI